MEMGLCWITVCGEDPVKYFDRYSGRFPLVHVKDWTTKGPGGSDYGGATGGVVKPGHMTDVGEGDIDWKRIFAQSGKAGIQHYIVENDEPKSPFDDLKVSYEYLAKLSVHTKPPSSCNWYFSFSLVSRSINSGAPASTAPPECSSLGIIASQSQFSVSYWRAEKYFGVYFPAGAAAFSLRTD